MRTFVSTVAMLVAFALTGPAFAGDVSTAKNQADCGKAGGMWNADSHSCAKKSGSGY